MAFSVYIDPILGEARALVDEEGSGGTSYIGGDRINIAGGTISFLNSADIVNVTGTSVTLQPDTAYKIYATSQAITLNANVLSAGKWAYDGHIELFVAGTGYVQTGANVVLANALEPDAVNNCTVRFHDGLAIISVEDHVAGYIVVSATGSTAGTLPYALGSASQEYVAFDATLNGQTLDMGGAVTNGEKHIVGNGYTETVISGGINCTAKTTVANLGMNGVVVSSGTLTMGDVYIPNGATVAVSGGSLFLDAGGSVHGSGVVASTLNLNNGYNCSVSGVTLSAGAGNAGIYSTYKIGSIMIQNAYFGGNSNAIFVSNSSLDVVITGCTFSGNSGTGTGVAFKTDITYSGATCSVAFKGCLFDGNISTGYPNANCIVTNNTTVSISGCTFGENENCYYNKSLGIGQYTYSGTNYIRGTVGGGTGTSVNIAAGAIVDLTGNTNNPTINPGGGVTFAQGGATILTGATAGVVDAQYMLGGLTVPEIGNTNVIGLSSTYAYISSNTSAVASNAIFSGGYASNVNGGAVVMGASASFSAFDCVFDKNSGYNAGGMIAPVEGCTLVLSGCTVTNNDAYNGGGVFLFSGASGELVSCTMSGNKGYTAGALHVNAGASVSLSGCTITGNIASSAFGGGLNAYGNANISACTISGNSQGDIRITSNTVLIKDSTVGLIATSGGTVTFEGTNTLASAGGGTGTVIISGASINLTSSINPGGGITVLTGGCTVNGVTVEPGTYTSIVSSGGSAVINQ